MPSARFFVGTPRARAVFPKSKYKASSYKAFGCLLVLTVVLCSCIERKVVPRTPPQQEAVTELTESERALAEEWILSKVSEKLERIIGEQVVHAAVDGELRVYRETWGDETPHVDIFFSDYEVRLPVDEIAGYPWESVMEQLETGSLGPILLKNGWHLWVGHIERPDAVSHDLSISVRETCTQLATSGDTRRDLAVRRLCSDFREGFQFADDLELFRRLWNSSFDVEEPTQLNASEALTTLFLGDLKRLMAPPGAGEHVAEVQTAWMEGLEFGDGTTEHGFSAELFDKRSHVTVLLIPPQPSGEPLNEEFRQKVLASVRRHGRWAPGLDMVGKAENVLQSPDLENSRELATLLLFSALQFPDHKTRAAGMLIELFPEDAPERDEVIAIVEDMIR